MFYHASQTAGIKTLKPRISNHEKPLVYFSSKRENTLVYLSNAVEKFCRETGISHDGPYHKWATYGFDCAGLLVLDEYYPHYIRETFQGVSGYIYHAELIPGKFPMTSIPDGFATDQTVPVDDAEFIPDAYEALLDAARAGLISLRLYSGHSEKMRAWIHKTVMQEYVEAAKHPEYQAFLEAKFPFVRR